MLNKLTLLQVAGRQQIFSGISYEFTWNFKLINILIQTQISEPCPRSCTSMRLYVKQRIHDSGTWTLEERDLGFIKNRNVCTKTKFQTKFVWLRIITFLSSLTLSVPYVLSDNTQKSQSFKVVLRSNLHCLEIPSSLNLCQGSLRTWHEYSLSWTFWKEHILNFVKQPYWEWKKDDAFNDSVQYNLFMSIIRLSSKTRFFVL